MSYNLTQQYAGSENPRIIGRDRELRSLYLTLLRFEKPNAILTGEPGVGKTAIVHSLAYAIANKLCPKPLIGFQVLEINSNKLLAGPGYRGVTEEKFQNIIDDAIANGKIILFMDEIHTIEHLGEMSNGQTPGLGNTLKPYLTRPDFRVIGCTTTQEFSKMTDKALLRRFKEIKISEPNDEAILSIIEACIYKYGDGITFTKSVIPKILELSKSVDGFNPDKAKDITDFLCSAAKLEEINKIGVKEVTEYFDTYFLMKKNDKPESKAVLVDEEDSSPVAQ